MLPIEVSVVLILGVLITLGFLLGMLSERLGQPRILGYILTGVLFSPDLLGRYLELSTDAWAPVLTDVALGIIAYLVGSKVDIGRLREQEGTVSLAVIGQSVVVFVMLSTGLWSLGHLVPGVVSITFPQAMIFGAIGVATAPATTLGVIEEYGARGPMTTILLGIIAIDDAVCIVVFTLVLGIAASAGSPVASLLTGAQELAGALLVGGVAGIILGYIGKKVHSEPLRLPVIVGFIFLVFGLSQSLHFSLLLACMTLGLVSTRFYPKDEADWVLPMEHVEELVFLFFFTLAGMSLELTVFTTSLGLVLAYIVLRSLGKYTGAWLGTAFSKADRQTQAFLGLCLLPQAGVSIGLAIRASHQPGLEQGGALLINVILASTIVFALISPLSTRFALAKAGEVRQSREQRDR